MKRYVILLVIIALLISASGTVKLARLTVVNKSEYNVIARLTGVDSGQYYYFDIPRGTKEYPETRVYTIIPDTYRWTITYVLQEDTLMVPIGEEYRELLISGKMRLNLLAPVTWYNLCDPEAYSLQQLLDNPNCRAKYLWGEQNNFKLIPLGIWLYKY